MRFMPESFCEDDVVSMHRPKHEVAWAQCFVGLPLCFNQWSNGFLRSRHLPDVVASSAEWAAFLGPWREGDSIWWFHSNRSVRHSYCIVNRVLWPLKQTNCRKLQKSTASWLLLSRHRLLVLRMVTINKSCANVDRILATPFKAQIARFKNGHNQQIVRKC
jgi:hypothetical protein